jgi:hypothetical protein
MVARGGSIRVSARTIAEEMGVSRREVYEALIDDQDSS